ncbi:MAG: HlyD family efflux transporter periplasmic adaptor subunit [Magnetospirillum sp.]|nr:HlyD family efflux transporter periplasmic adaptor subunit [Magnetospirillum sp.]
MRPRLLALEGDAERLQGERDDFAARIAQVQQGIASTQLEIANVDYRHLEEVANTLRDVEGDIRKVEQERAAIQDQLRRTVIRAPQDGVVVNMKIHTVGAVVSAGDSIMTVVPEAERLVVVARVRPEDIDRVRTGRRAQARFRTFLPGITPPAYGKVTRVSADLLHDERTGQGYYRARVRLDPNSLRRLPGPPLPGMQADVLIDTGARTALEYLIDPLARAMALAMREK